MEVIVLGMHRSGTSLVASILETLGVDMGDDLLPNHWEDRAFIALNDRILAACGGSWHTPPPIEAIKATPISLRAEAKNLIQERSHKPLWGWKDPRTCITFPVYNQHLTDPKIIVVWRNRDDIIKSLVKRDGAFHADPGALVDEYRYRIAQSGHILVTYESLTNERSAGTAIQSINKVIGGNGNVDEAIARIRFR